MGKLLIRNRLLFILLVLFILVGCSANQSSSNTNDDIEEQTNEEETNHSSDETIMIESNNTLGFKLLHEVESIEDNIFISPLSAFIAVLLATNGADGETKREMKEALQIEEYSLDEVNESVLALSNKLQQDVDEIELSIANSIWLNDRYHYDRNFSEKAMNFFAAKHEMIHIDDEKSADLINDWVSEATNEKITEMVEKPLDQDFLAMILNAIYFHGKWQYPFDPANTTESIFYKETEEVAVPFMMLEEELLYFENDLFQAAQLPYGSGEMSMQVFLPKENIDMESFLEQLTEENWTIWNSEFQRMSGTIHLPKFQVEYESSLNKAFNELGIELAFDEHRAEFPNLIEENEQIYIDEIKQKTFIDVSEEGTEAAGATSVEMRLTSAIVDEETFYMDVNRPFFMTIKDEETNALLFIGIIKNPKQG